MSRSLLVFTFVLAFKYFNCDVYEDRPRIRTSNGNVILEPAYGKNIYLQPKGPQSTVYIGNVNILKSNISAANNPIGADGYDDVSMLISGRNGILEKLHRLESQQTKGAASAEIAFNLTLLRNQISTISTSVLSLRRQVRVLKINQCRSRPCNNGGTCLSLVGDFHCLCPNNWEGKDCSIDVNECQHFAGTDLGCQNGAVCINTPGSYSCLCRNGWFGLHCTRKAKDCSGGNYEMCGHGTCIPVTTGEGINCICDQGWTKNGTSVECLTDINECESNQSPRCSINPKVDCVNLPGSFKCGTCPVGYEGDGYYCSDIDECLIMPNGGCSLTPRVSCINTLGSRICGSCPQGYIGDGVICTWKGSCNIDGGGCHPSAQCIESGGTVQCNCPEGMDGDGFGPNGCFVSTNGNSTLHCQNRPCGTYGRCIALALGYTCVCASGYGGAHCDLVTNNCSNNPCKNGGVCRPSVESDSGFSCECTSRFKGRFCQTPAKVCGGVLEAEEGNIVYPDSNTTYNHNSKCAWVIHTSLNKVINVTFNRFDIEYTPDCLYDFLQIHDGRNSASQLVGRFCGTEFPKGGNIISSHNNLYFWFSSDQSFAKTGFSLHWNIISPQCGGEVDARHHGRISSPGSPGAYPPNRDCYWHLTTTEGKRIQIFFFELDIEIHESCKYDYLAIYDGSREADRLINRYCNSSHPQPLKSSGSELYIHFHSDAIGSGKGFQISYATVEGIPGCGGDFTLDKGELVSPSFEGKYINNIICEYKIRTKPGTKIRIKFKSFSIETSNQCKYDYLKIYDGSTADSKLYGQFCGNVLPPEFLSSTNNLFLKFSSDRSVSSEGFRITYESVCTHILTGDSGIVKSPGYPFNYTSNTQCEYIISTTPGKAIQLMFQDFDIEFNQYFNCTYDYVEIRDGPDLNSTILGRFCGSKIPPIITSTHNFMYIRFSSDMSVSGAGFYANFTTLDIRCGGIYKDLSGIISYPSVSELKRNSMNIRNCTWILIAPIGNYIKLTWNRFDIKQTDSCRDSYVELAEVDENNNLSTFPKFCGSSLPAAITTDTNKLRINFQSKNSLRNDDFSLSYTYLAQNQHCGRTFIRTHGYIYSPGWPNKYMSNKDCEWTITVPPGQQIKLNISLFDLERPIRQVCDFGDYLEIRNGLSNNSPLIGKYCGYNIPKIITSMGHTLYLHFHSDYYITSRGFKLEFEGTVKGCGGTLSQSTGAISSPDYPHHYHENAECFYKIITNPGSKLKVSFIDIDLEITNNCRNDYVEIFDGRDSNAASLGKFCTMTEKSDNIETTGHFALVKFRSDFLLSGKGFLLNYHTICQNNITGSYGVIESPDFPGNYHMNTNCRWRINVPIGNSINITFTHFDISPVSYYRHTYPYNVFRPSESISSKIPTNHCQTDYVQIKETSGSYLTSKLCGNNIPAKINSRTNSVEVVFTSGSYFTRTGFRLEWVRNGCGGHIHKPSGILNFDKSLTSGGPLECEWIIVTPPGTSVSITFSSIYMDTSPNCTRDVIEIYSGEDSTSPLLTKFCHDSLTSVKSNNNLMFIKLIKRSNIRNIHFSSAFDNYGADCGGRMEARHGTISSKNYPKNYDNDLDCTWILIVPYNHRIALNFLEIDLYSQVETPKGQCNDQIRVYDTLQLNTNFSQIICPDTQISTITSKTNILRVQFITDSSGTAKGFKANFSITCGATIYVKNDGILKNDEFTTQSNKNCSWTLIAQELHQKVSLTITYMSLPKDRNVSTNTICPSSYLRILDGNDEHAPLIGEYCGTKVPPMIVSRGSMMTVIFGSYTNTATGKFSAHYTTIDTACGGQINALEGTIASPNYPNSYPANINCEWTINTAPGNKAYITFENFDLGYSESCNLDYLEIRKHNGAGSLIGLYCGSDLPLNTTIASELYVKFHSNSVNKETRQGFLFHYGLLHNNDITGSDTGEISSPSYPNKYDGPGEFQWTINSNELAPIVLIIDRLDIKGYGSDCNNALLIYDGLDDQAELLQKMCGVLRVELKRIQTSSNVVLIKLKLDESNSGSLFHLRWRTITKVDETTSGGMNCGSNSTIPVIPGAPFTINSPNYPLDYTNNLNCEWVFKANPGRHLSVYFENIEIEEVAACFADYISIYSSTSAVGEWKPIKEKICEKKFRNKLYQSSNYLKIEFKTDASIVGKGFLGHVKSNCGGHVKGSAGVISVNRLDVMSSISDNHFWHASCEWTLKVRPGRTIKASFEHFNITNKNDNCPSYVILRNGESIEAPLLGTGKYCGLSHEHLKGIETSSNSLNIVYKIHQTLFQNFILRYEEKNVECGFTGVLDADHTSEVINSPNYPAVPTSYSECNWVFRGPPGDILKIDFIERFDLQRSLECSTEYVEVHDGTSDLAPVIGKYCSERPGTIKTTSNYVYIKYVTQMAEPRNGFKANISIDVCGGTIISKKGEIASPGYPHLTKLPTGTICEWKVIGTKGNLLKIKAQDIDLPASDTYCGNKVTIEEYIYQNKTTNILKTYCEEERYWSAEVESTTNEISVKLYIETYNNIKSITDYKGFRLTFKESRHICGGTITASEGFLTTPGYPRDTSIRLCQWQITAPDESRRIRLEILDSHLGPDKGSIVVYNDHNYASKVYSNNETNIYESSGNKMALLLWLLPLSPEHRFKARYSSNEPALCGGQISGPNGEIVSPAVDRTYYCEWHYFNNLSDSLTLLVKVTVQSSSNSTQCRFSDSKLSIRANIDNGPPYHRDICSLSDVAYTFPATNVDFQAVQKSNPFSFHLSWSLQPCGGLVYVSEESINILNFPKTQNSSLDCLWYLRVPIAQRVEITLEGDFVNDCSSEYIKIKQGTNQYVLREYCQGSVPDSVLTMDFSYIYVNYHSESNHSNIKLKIKTVNDQCGGFITKHRNIFSSPNYPNNYYANQECVWEIQAELGTRISIKFIDRFVIEQKENCTKDAVLVYDWIKDDYVQIAKLCGRQLPPIFNSTGDKMKIVLRTDNDINLDGFRVLWTPICGGTFNATDKEQFLYSPGYPNSYLPNMQCDYQIQAKNEKILIKFLTFELEGPFPECKYDNLTILGNYYEYTTFCGRQLPSPQTHSNIVKLYFKTDRYAQMRGFKISYQKFFCGGNVTSPGEITSNTGNDSSYEQNSQCLWFVTAPKNKIVVLKFLYIDMENDDNCESDYIEVFNGLRVDINRRLALMCGHINSTTVIKSTGETLLLKFVSDFALSYRGFKVDVLFSSGESVGCGGQIDLSTNSERTVKSPLLPNSTVYDSYLHCQWSVKAPVDYSIQIEFRKFHVAPCENVNQTSVGYSKCNCDVLQIRDGLNPNSLLIGAYCGHNLPPILQSSGNKISLSLLTDGDIASTGFEATLRVIRSVCGQSNYVISDSLKQIKTPGFDVGDIPRGEHCIYNFKASEDAGNIHIKINEIDLQEGTSKNVCDRDKVIIMSTPSSHNSTIGKDFIINDNSIIDRMSSTDLYFDNHLGMIRELIFCGKKSSFDIYVSGDFQIDVQTYPVSDSMHHHGISMDVKYTGYCARNYTEPFGRIQVDAALDDHRDLDCYTLITAAENHTISLYFITLRTSYWNDKVYLDVYNGKNTKSTRLTRITSEYEENMAVFSTGRYLLLHYQAIDDDRITFDLNYVTSNQGEGCGGKLYNILGVVTSPKYPDIFRKTASCEWELETPQGTLLRLDFTTFDLGKQCEQNYVELVNREGRVISTYCSEPPAEFTSADNYVKIVFKTTRNNSGTGWIAKFVATTGISIHGTWD